MSALKICPQCGTEYELDQRFCPKDGTTLRTQGGATADLVGSIIADRYHVLRKLGEGGMGTVFLAEHVKMGRKSAVKVMNPGMVDDADAISRFNREAANASRINHPNVAAVYDFGETADGVIYLAMEFVEGPSLTKLVHDSGALSPSRAAEITRQAAEALTVAHDMGIVHRDLKPDNIMLAKNRDGTDCVKVVDFGIAKAANNEAQKVTKTGLVVGTPEYMSPEQLAGDVLDGRSDTYSLALVAFNMFTGKLPFPAESQQESMIMRLTTSPKLLSEMKPDTAWSAEVQAVMDRALDRDAAARYNTASDFGRELYKAVQTMPATDVTKAFTALMPPPVKPSAPPAGSATSHAPTAPRRSVPTPVHNPVQAPPQTAAPSKGVPATKVNPATPAAPVRAIQTPRKTKLPMLTGVAVAVLVVGGVSAYLASLNNSANGAIPAQQGETTKRVPLNQPLTTPAPPAVDLDTELEQIGKLTDVSVGSPTTATEALTRLDRLATATMTTEQRVGAALRRAEANTLRDSTRAACTAVMDVEGASKGTKYERQVAFILKNACK